MGATFSRLKNWTTEVLSNSDLNAEIDNILNNLGPAGVDDYSTNAAQMRTQTSPGDVGSESLATSLAGELERIRYVLSQIKGSSVSYWYQPSTTSLSDLSSAVGGGLPDNRISSGRTTSNSNQLCALDPSGTTTSVTLLGASTNFIYYIGGDQYSITADTTITGLSAAPSANATASIGDAQAGDNQWSEFFGEYGTSINMTAAGSEFASRVGTFQAFSINNGAATEYFVGYLNSTSQITRAWRGPFFDSSNNAIPKVRFTSGDNLTLQRLGWIFANTSASLAVSYTTPVYAHSEPSAPSTGDYWFDIPNSIWKIFNSTNWVTANATLVGMTVQSSAACVAARTFDKFTSVSDLNTMRLEWSSNSVLQTKDGMNSVNVFGTPLSYGLRPVQWDMASHLDSGLSESASTFYYFYVKESGAPLISDKSPVDMRGSRRGLYHPSETWRCIGCAFNDSSSNLLPDTVHTFDLDQISDRKVSPSQPTSYRLNASVNASAMTVSVRDAIGNYPSQLIPTVIPIRNVTATVGSYASRILTSMPQIEIGSASTLGHGNSRSCPIYAYLIDSGTSYDLAVTSAPKFNVAGLYTTLAIGSTGTADNGTAMYTTAALTAKPGALMGYMIAPQTTGGIWTAAPTTISVGAFFPEHDYVTASVDNDTPAGDVQWLDSGCSFTLDPGEWEILGYARWISTANVNSNMRLKFAAADGGDSGSEPAAVTTLTGVTAIAGFVDYIDIAHNSNHLNDMLSTHLVLRTTQTNTFYLVAYSDNSGNGLQLDLRVFAKRLRA